MLNTYREAFRGEPDLKERRNIFKTKVLVDIFNHWHTHKKSPADGAETEAAIKVRLQCFPVHSTENFNTETVAMGDEQLASIPQSDDGFGALQGTYQGHGIGSREENDEGRHQQ